MSGEIGIEMHAPGGNRRHLEGSAHPVITGGDLLQGSAAKPGQIIQGLRRIGPEAPELGLNRQDAGHGDDLADRHLLEWHHVSCSSS